MLKHLGLPGFYPSVEPRLHGTGGSRTSRSPWGTGTLAAHQERFYIAPLASLLAIDVPLSGHYLLAAISQTPVPQPVKSPSSRAPSQSEFARRNTTAVHEWHLRVAKES